VKIVALTDVHGAYDRVTGILEQEQPCDVVVVGGDITTHGSPQEAERAIRQWSARCKTLLAVAGNMDPPSIDEHLIQLGISINGRGVTIGDAGFFGVSGSPVTPMRTPNEVSEAEIARRIQQGWDQISTACWKVFVPHAPPRDTIVDRVFLGKHVGSTAVRSFIEQHQPDIVLCGHIHEARGQDQIGSSRIVNCGPAAKGYYALVHIDKSIRIEVKEG